MHSEYAPDRCDDPDHVDGCPGAAGGDHEYRLSMMRCDECGELLLVDGSCRMHGEFNVEGQPEFNGAFR